MLPAAPQGGAGRGDLQSAVAQLTPERRAEYDRRLAAIDANYPADPGATVADFVNREYQLAAKHSQRKAV